MSKTKIKNWATCLSLIIFGITGGGLAMSSVLTEADSFTEGFPYIKTFVISAYYSPLPCQSKYVTGSFAGDVRLNGDGVHSADGSMVYPGMIAAPKTYPFGTKMQIPDVGIVAVHDRGGAIVHAGEKGQDYDRLDVWMGYGDKGLRRALNWGKRTLDVTVYGVNDEIQEQVSLYGYSAEEANVTSCESPDSNIISPPIYSEGYGTKASIDFSTQKDKFENDLSFGDVNNDVVALQKELNKLNLLQYDPTGYYGELTKHAIFKFQQTQFLISQETDEGAGVFGAKTRKKLNEILTGRKYSTKLIADATTEYVKKNPTFLVKNDKGTLLASEMDSGIVSDDVKILQNFLRTKGYYRSPLLTTYFGPMTKDALIKFQLENNLISSPDDKGAGRVGPATLEIINSFS